MSKRQRFVTSSLVLSILSLSLPVTGQIFYSALLLIFLSAGLTYWSLGFDLTFIEKLIFPTLPTLLSLTNLMVSLTLFKAWFSWWLLIGTNMIIAFIYYLTFLSLNVLNVATIRPAPLRKAAMSTINFLALPLFAFFFYEMSLFEHNLIKLGLINVIVFFFLFFALMYFGQIDANSLTQPSLMEEMRPGIKSRPLDALVAAILMLQVLLMSFFWPSNQVFRTIFIGGAFFILVGFLQNFIKRQLNQRLIYEYLLMGIVILLVFFFSRT